MCLDRLVMRFAGVFVLLSLVLAHYVNVNWLWFTAFVGANLLQSSLTGWCMMSNILGAIGIGGKTREA